VEFSGMSEQGIEARRFARAQQSGVLSTLSKRLEGYPFGSVSPFILDHAGRPVILISEIAEHTKNIDADPRVSIIVQPYSQDMQVTGRVTLVGRAERLSAKDGLGPRYLRYFPQAEGYFSMHDFHFYRVEPVKIRWIGGFGRIFWIDPEAWLAAPGILPEAEDGILAHMNADHADSLRGYCRHFHGLETDSAEMIGIDPDGFDVRAGERILRFDFAAPIGTAEEARAALVEMARLCRA
jgi:putative heme iron utilization protein